MYNHYYKHGNIAVLAIPRCASESLASGRHLTLKEASSFPRVFAFVRDPFPNLLDDGRIASGYRMFEPFPEEPRHAKSYEAYVDRILDSLKGNDYVDQEKDGGRIKGEPTTIPVDPHWVQQSTLIRESPVPVTEVWRFESLNDIIKGLPHFHESDTKIPFDPTYRLDELQAYYASDLELRKSASGN